MSIARYSVSAALVLAAIISATNMSSAQTQITTHVTLATATPGGGFPFFGDNAAAVINETDKSLNVETQNTKGSAENIGLLNDRKVDIALVAGEPAYEAFQGIGQPKTTALVIQAIYSNPGMFAVRGDSPAKTLRDLVGKPIAWGTRASGLTLLGRYVTDGLGLDREKDFEPHYLEKAGDGPLMVADGRVAALWGGGVGWPGFTAVMQAGGRFIGLTPDEVTKVTAKHNFLKPITVPAGAYPGQKDAVNSVGSWSYILARADLADDVAYRLAKALNGGHTALVKRLDQAKETTPQSTFMAAPSPQQIHPGVQKYLREVGVMK
ncbi:TAXI family TRAP transporter solute-binding subunit [Rhodoplanes sp. Z2-YC6860]|uniref:TAXI family TRAP transporter solute-binding subunit n=1 Tax=Rhodoplanes sp. Z2-YC6860 TaxID=674703 RepID=UPI00078DC220|nr:TAXI family TRAP transporter solute-binding subunit [Rhodoplanes sp. Z2-YC6860]AMN42261.1 TRAP transporter solute receptor, TAXI family [Rhodoplanes sp. Z2-YC6860]